MKSISVYVGLALAWLLLPVTVGGQQEKWSAFGDAQVVVAVDVEQFRATELGRQLMKVAQKQAQEALGEMGDGDKAPTMDEVKEFLGFDPFEEIRGAVIAIDDIEEPEQNMVAIIQMGETTGNIEGLLLGLPGYQSEKKNGMTIHSADYEGQEIYGVIRKVGDNKVLVIAPDKDKLLQVAEQASDIRQLIGQSSAAKSTFIRILVNELPEELMEDGPQAAVVKFLESIQVTVGQASDNLVFALELTVDNEEHAEQLRQMANGLKAMIGFAMTQEEMDEEMKKAAELAQGMEVSVEGTQLNLSISLPVDVVMDFLQDEMGRYFKDN
jgi:hypothetical protein